METDHDQTTVHLDASIWRDLLKDLLWWVLGMLPIGDLWLYRAVCREWRMVLSSPGFLASFFRRRTSLHLDRAVLAWVGVGEGSSSLQQMHMPRDRPAVGARGPGTYDGMLRFDLGFVPGTFWRALVTEYAVAAASEGEFA